MFNLKEKFGSILLLAAVAVVFGFAGGYVAQLGSSAYALSSLSNSLKQNSSPLALPAATFSQETAIVNIVKKYSPAVVSVIISKDVPILEQCYINPLGNDPVFNDPFFQQFFGGSFQIPSQCQKGTQHKEVGGGSGFIISVDGLIVTNKHVVSDTKADYTVLTNDGKKYTAKIVARDPLKDIAVIKIEATNLPTVILGDSSGVEIGQTAIAIGNALGEFRNTVSTGIISGLARTITASGGGQSEELRNIIQTDAAINPGNSGGPLLNLKGEVIGVDVAVAEGAQGIGFAIPINQVKKSINDAQTKGKIVYPFLGVKYLSITDAIQKDNNLPVANGAWLKPGKTGSMVVKGSPADKAGLKDGDIITAINDEKITENILLSDIIERYNVGDTVKLTVIRGGQTMTVSVTLEERKF